MLSMLNLLRSLSLETGAVVIMAASAVIGAGLSRITNTILRRILASSVPLVLAYSLYWSPVWLGADPSEYSSWAPLFILPWFLAGLLASITLVYLINRKHRVVNKLKRGGTAKQ
jgi:hypothetical protein